MKALFFPTDDLPRYVELNPTLDNLQAIVGGPIEALPVKNDERATAYIHENGKLHNEPANHYATRRMFDILFMGDHIAGPMLVIGITPSGEHEDIPPELAHYMMERCRLETNDPCPTDKEKT